MFEAQWSAKSDDEIQQALSELDTYTPEAQQALQADKNLAVSELQ